MTADTSLNDYMALELQSHEDNKTIKNATNAIKNGSLNFCSKTNDEQEISEDYQKMLNMTALSIKMFANSHYKPSAYLEPREIDQIKNSLNNYTKSSERVNNFKQELIEDLTEFQKQIKAKHIQRIAGLTKERQIYEKQIKILDSEKNQLIMSRLSKISWPYDKKTKEYDSKIAQLQTKMQQYIKKIEDLQKMRPAANEKDIMIYRLHLKEKFANNK